MLTFCSADTCLKHFFEIPEISKRGFQPALLPTWREVLLLLHLLRAVPCWELQLLPLENQLQKHLKSWASKTQKSPVITGDRNVAGAWEEQKGELLHCSSPTRGILSSRTLGSDRPKKPPDFSTTHVPGQNQMEMNKKAFFSPAFF